MAVQKNTSTTLQGQIHLARQQFEAQLISLRLTKEQIESQNIEELQQSLECVNDAIEHPEAFGTVKLKFTAEIGAVITTNAAEANYEVGILPILLERKKIILDRIRVLKGEEKIESVRDLVMKISEDKVRQKLEKELEDLKVESGKLLQQSKEVEQVRVQEEITSREKLIRLEMESSERKAKIYQSFLEKESMATIIGSILLLGLTITQVIAMFREVVPTEIINSSFLLILGYFFGQTINKTPSKIE